MAVAVTVTVVVAVWFVFGRDAGVTTPGDGLSPVAAPMFAEDGGLPAGPSRAVYSPTGTRLAVLNAGRVFVAVEGRLEPVTAEGGNVVDVAWFGNGTTLLVIEGPAATGQVAVVDIDGTVRGVIPLSEPVSPGSGHGMAVAPGGRSAVVTAVDRPPLAAEQRHLVTIDLETGRVSDRTAPGGEDEYGPVFTPEGDVVYSTADATVAGVTDVGDVVLLRSDGALVTRAGVELGVLPEGVALVDLAPLVDRALVVSTDESGQPRLREITLTRRRAR